MAFRCLSAVYRGGNRCAPSPSPLRYACLILPPFLRGAANRLTHYFLHPFRSFTVNSCVKLIIHRRHWRLFTSRAPLGFRRLLPFSFLLSLLFFSFLFSVLFLFDSFFFFVFLFGAYRILFSRDILIGKKKLREESESWWMLVGFNEGGREGGRFSSGKMRKGIFILFFKF